MKEFTHCVHDLSAATIAEGDREMQSIEMGGFLFGGPDPLEGGGREGVESADRAHNSLRVAFQRLKEAHADQKAKPAKGDD
jgi:hypothetical protein